MLTPIRGVLGIRRAGMYYVCSPNGITFMFVLTCRFGVMALYRACELLNFLV